MSLKFSFRYRRQTANRFIHKQDLASIKTSYNTLNSHQKHHLCPLNRLRNENKTIPYGAIYRSPPQRKFS